MSDLSPGAQLITEVIKAAEKASELGLSTKYIAEILEDVTKDLKVSDADTHRAEIDAAEPNRPVLPGVMPRYFAVWSATGVHVGIWDDGPTAAKVLGEYPGGVMRDLFDGETVQSQIDAAAAAERERCAEIAISEPVKPPASMDEDEAEFWWQGGDEIGTAIAAAIRKGGQP